MTDNLMDYTIYDVEGGEEYKVRVSEDRIAELNLDHLKRHRLLEELKAKGHEPVGRWADVSLEPSPVQNVPKAPKAAGRSGKWQKATTNTFLQVCRPFRKELRATMVPSEVWQSISKKLSELGIIFTPDEVKEKMRNVKRSFKDAKSGKNRGASWDYYQAMVYLYDEPLDEPILSCNNSPQMSVVDNEGEGEALLFDAFLMTPDDEDCFRDNNNANLIVEVTNISEVSNTSSVATCDVQNVPDYQKVGEVVDLQSPSRKRSRTGNGETPKRTPIKTPNKTPKRKQPSTCNVVWPRETTTELVKQCVRFKREVQVKNAPPEVWRQICSNMEANGHGDALVTWQTCRSKFQYMNYFFEETLLPLNGVLSGVKWPHYEDFLTIHDLPGDYVAPVINDKAKDNFDWNTENTCLLIQLYKERIHLFKNTKSTIRHSTLYREIAGIMQMFHHDVCEKQCEGKVTDLSGKFRIEYDKVRKTGAAPSTWEFYEMMLEIFEGTATLEAPAVVSVGGTSGLLHKGKPAQEMVRLSRTRTTTSYSSSEKGSKALGKQSGALALQARSIEAKESLANEVRLMRTTMEAQSDRRLGLMELLVQSVGRLAASSDAKRDDK